MDESPVPDIQPGMPETKPKIPLRRWAMHLLVVLVILEGVYLGVANALLQQGTLPRLLSRNPDRLSIQWASGWTFFPGLVHVRELVVRARTSGHEWELRVDRAETRADLPALVFRTFRTAWAQVEGIEVQVRSRVVESAGQDVPPGPASSVVPQSRGPRGWLFALNELEASGIRRVQVDDYELSGDARFDGDLSIALPGPVAAAQGMLSLSAGTLTVADVPIAEAVSLDGAVRLDAFDPRAHKESHMLRFLSGALRLEVGQSDYAFINHYLTGPARPRISGGGHVRATLNVERGMLLSGSELSLTPLLEVEILNYRASGVGQLNAQVQEGPAGPVSRLHMQLDDVVFRESSQQTPHFRAPRLEVFGTGSALEAGVRPSYEFSLELADGEIPDIRVFNSYLPEDARIKFLAGAGALSAAFRVTDEAMTGQVRLSGEAIQMETWNEPIVATVEVRVPVSQGLPDTRRFDLSGTRITVTEAGSREARKAGAEPWKAEVVLSKGWLETSAADRDAKRPNRFTDAELVLEGGVSDIGFLNKLLPPYHDLRLGGDAGLAGHLHIREGLLSPGSELMMTPVVKVHVLDYEATGQGTLTATVKDSAEGRRGRMSLSLRDVVFRRSGQRTPHLRSARFEVTAEGPLFDPDAEPADHEFVLRIPAASVPDIRVFNDYLPDGAQLRFTAGKGTLRARLKAVGTRASGRLELSGDGITVQPFDQPLVGDISVVVPVKEADLDTGRLNIAGTRIQVKDALPSEAGKVVTKPWDADVLLEKAWVEASTPEDRPGGRRTLRFPDGGVELRGQVSDILFLNRLIPSSHSLRFAGAADLHAALQVARGQVAPGSRVSFESERLFARFLDFEAGGRAVVEAGIEGRLDARKGRLMTRFAEFDLRRLDDEKPHVNGLNLTIETLGDRFSVTGGMRSLTTDVHMPSARIPDITAYNRYLPREGAVSFVSGKGEMAARIEIVDEIASGGVSLLADDVFAEIREQTVRGDLAIQTRLARGNPRTMEFDVSGSTVRLADVHLKTGDRIHDEAWWGQFDLREGRLVWRQPLEVDGKFKLHMRDTGPLVHFFVKRSREPGFVNRFLTVKDIEGQGEIYFDKDTVSLQGVELNGRGLKALTTLEIVPGPASGALYVQVKGLAAAFELADGKRKLKLFGARDWYDGYVKENASP